MQVCAMGYTTPFWDEARWMKEIDWMALHGFDLPLVYPAYEAIFARVMKKLGLTAKEIEASFSGPAHLPWSRMGNTSGGPDRTPPEWLARSVRMQIGTDFIREWEKEFGPGTYYLADSFNECGLPWKDEASIRRGLKACGAATYNAVLAGHPTHDVRRWIVSARACAEGNETLANAYETNARRIIKLAEETLSLGRRFLSAKAKTP